MNILMLGWELPPHNSGGMGVACYHMSKALALQGADIDFVVPYTATHPGIDFMKIHGATPVSPLEQYGMGIYDSANYLKKCINSKDKPSSIQELQSQYIKFVEKFLETHSPDAIHAHDWLTMEAGVRAKELTDAPLIVHVHATEFDRSGSLQGNPAIHEIEYNGLMMADRIIAVSNATKSIIIQNYQIPADKIEVVYNAADIDGFNDGYQYDMRTYTYLEALKAEGYTIFSSFGRLTIQKGFTHLVDGFAKACEKNYKMALLIVGSGEQRDELISLATDYGIADKVFFTGWIGGKKWRDAYTVSEVFIMSSVSEPFGLSALEAAHHDNALIISKQSGVGEVLHSVFRYDFWDIDKLADQIVGLATTDSLKKELAINVKKEYDRISWHDVATSCINIYSKLTSGSIL